MKKKLPRYGLVIILLCCKLASFGQDQKPLILTADSLTSGNAKDVFKSFLQLAFDHITGDNKELRFASNPYAIMTRIDSTLRVDTNYIKYTYLRNLNFSLSGKLDSAYRFNGFSSGVTYALINKRDETISRGFLAQAAKNNGEFRDLNDSLSAYISALLNSDHQKALRFNLQRDSLANGLLTFDKIDPELQGEIRKILGGMKTKSLLKRLNDDPKLNFHAVEFQSFDSLRTEFQKGWLWTVSASDTTYKDQFFFSNVVLSTEILKGMSHAKHAVGVELDLKGSYQFLDDTLRPGRDLGRQVLNIQPGLNLVFTTKKNNYSWAEFKLSGEYNRIFKGGYTGEKTDSLTLNATLRIRITKDIWLPLEIKYDPKSGNVFGFLNVRLNFGSPANSSKKS